MIYLVCYDLTNDRERTALAKVLKGHGQRVQRSVFEISIRSRSELMRLVRELNAVTEESDGIRLYRLCRNCRADSRTLSGEDVARFPATYVL